MKIRPFNLALKRPSFRRLRLRPLINLHVIQMCSLPQRPFLRRRIPKDLLWEFGAKVRKELVFEEFVQWTGATHVCVGLEVAGVLVHGDVYYAVEDGEDGGSRCGIGIIDCETLFVLQVGVPERMRKKVLAHGCGAALKESKRISVFYLRGTGGGIKEGGERKEEFYQAQINNIATPLSLICKKKNNTYVGTYSLITCGS
jgi:hypothetical protein